MKILLPFSVLVSGLFFVGCGETVEFESGASPSISVGDVSVEEASSLVDKEIQVLDIRTPLEFAEGHIPGALNIDYKAPDFAEKIKDLDASKPYLMHCESGGRSGASLPTFQALGFSEIYHLKSGMSGWREAGLEVEK